VASCWSGLTSKQIESNVFLKSSRRVALGVDPGRSWAAIINFLFSRVGWTQIADHSHVAAAAPLAAFSFAPLAERAAHCRMQRRRF
jgi:hypothetical protein